MLQNIVVLGDVNQEVEPVRTFTIAYVALKNENESVLKNCNLKIPFRSFQTTYINYWFRV